MSEPHILKPAWSGRLSAPTKSGSLPGSQAMACDAWDKFRKDWRNPYGSNFGRQVLNALRGEAEPPPKNAAWPLLEDCARYLGSARYSGERIGL